MKAKFLRTKKAQTDVTIMWVIIMFFIILGFITPYIQADFQESRNMYNTDDLTEGLDDETDFSAISSITILTSIGKMFFWNWGSIIPIWLEVCLFLPLRIILALLIYRQIRSGGG